MKKENNNTFSIFDSVLEEVTADASPKIDVVNLTFESAVSMNWTELFSGFDSICAITFSSGVGFMYKLLDMFETAEVIFGCEDVMSNTVQEIMAYQNRLIERMRDELSDKKQAMLARIDSGEVRFYVSRGKISHEKMYLLSSRDGRKRVITGSANMSYNAFSGTQRENICCIDGERAYDWYFESFSRLKSESSDEITHKAIDIADISENIDELPISQTIKVNKVVEIVPDRDNDENVEFSLDTRNLANRLTPLMPKADRKTGRILVSSDMITKLRRQLRDDEIKKKEQESVYPRLVIDTDTAKVTLNDSLLDLNPPENEVARDVRLFIRYMDGYSQFHGNFADMQQRYFEFANWFFCSPFMAKMRDMAARFDQNRLPYPVFGLIYGQSKAGKTSFLETLLKMMIGQKPKIPAQEFTRSSIEGLKHKVEGCPIIVDDMVNTRFNQHAIETIKTEDFGISEHLIHYPAVVISANEDVKAVSPEIIRRTVICRVEAGLTNTEVMTNNVVRSVQKEIGTAFYREYLRRMLEIVPNLVEQLKSDDSDRSPDILKESSDVIYDIIAEHSEIPAYVRHLTLENYFSEKVTGKYAIKTIQNAWRTSPKTFTVDERRNELRYDAGATYEADRIIKELPENLEAAKSRDSIIMNLNEAREFFGVKFKKSWLW